MDGAVQNLDIQIPHLFKPRDYQLGIMTQVPQHYRRGVFIHHRRAGKDKSAWNKMIKEALKKKAIYYYFFPTYKQGRKAIWDAIDPATGIKFLDHIPKELLAKKNDTEMKLILVNGSLLQIVGVDNFDQIMGTAPYGCVFSEYSLQDPKVWDYIRPILRENGGWAIFVYCVHEDTFVMTQNGMCRIGDIEHDSSSEFTDINLNVYGLGGMHKAVSFYNGGVRDLLEITVGKGYRIKCTPNHKLWDGFKWVRADEYKVGDYLPIQRGQNVWGKDIDISGWKKPSKHKALKNLICDKEISTDFMWLLGLILAEGWWSDTNCSITNIDEDVVNKMRAMGFKTQDKYHHVCSSMSLCSFLDWFGLKRGAKNKRIPSKVFGMPKKHVAAFISGYFDGDGSSSKRNGAVHCDSVSEDLIRDLQVLLLNFGIISRIRGSRVKPTKRVKKESFVWRLEIDGSANSRLFYDEISFGLVRKQANRSKVRMANYGHCVPLKKDLFCKFVEGIKSRQANPYKHMARHTNKETYNIRYATLKKFLKDNPNEEVEGMYKDNFYWDKIKSIVPCKGKVFDFVIPDTHSFFSNGFISHNTPRGLYNHGYELYKIACESEDWYVEIRTVRDTKREDGSCVVGEEDIQKERDERMPEELINQEYFCDFQGHTEGAYYAKQMRQARDDGRITKVPYIPNLEVYTAWDLGVDDSTTIWFYQVLPMPLQFRFIDYYENTGEGLSHYAKVLQDNKYKYGDHYLPHDGDARKLGETAESPRQILERLGIRPIRIVKRPRDTQAVMRGIQAVRNVLSQCCFDKTKCTKGIVSLQNYHAKYDEDKKKLLDHPEHDHTSHASDSFRTFAVGHDIKPKNKKSVTQMMNSRIRR